MKLRVAVVYGGGSSERGVSVSSGSNIYDNIDRENYIPYLVFLSEDNQFFLIMDGAYHNMALSDFTCRIDGVRLTFDYVYIAVHGGSGENGELQEYFKSLGIPYSSSDATASALAYDKNTCKEYLKGMNDTSFIILPNNCIKKLGDGAILNENIIVRQYIEIMDHIGFSYPCFVKPCCSGSSFGSSKVDNDKDLDQAIKKAFSEDDNIIIEPFIKGTEVTCGIYKNGTGFKNFQITEIVPNGTFFDYDAKYNNNSNEITPANITEEMRLRLELATKNIYDFMGCRGIIRIDYIISGTDVYFLEVNTVPGMSDMSIIPKQIDSLDMTMQDVLSDIIEHTKHK